MARNTPLASVVAMLKAELGQNQTVGVAQADDLMLACMVAEKQRWLADSFDWPFLKDRWDVQVNNGNRFIDFPTADQQGLANTTINFERPVRVSAFWSARWKDVIYGIDEEEFNYLNSDGTPPDQGQPPQILDPVLRWQFFGENLFEIWPIPASPQTVRFVGQRNLTPVLSASYSAGPPAGTTITPLWTATLNLDDNMVMLFAAAELLQKNGKANAGSVLNRAQNRMAFIRASYPKREIDCAFGRGSTFEKRKVVGVKTPILVA